MKIFYVFLLLLGMSFLSVPSWAVGTTNAKFFLDEGVGLFQQEKYFEAIDSLRNAIEINPYYGDAYKYLADVYFSLGEYSTSLENSLNALKYANNDPDTMLIVANSYRELGIYDKSENYYKTILDKFPSYVEVYRNLAELYLKMNKLPLALTTLNKADRVNKNYWKNYISYGNYYRRSGNNDKAEEYFKKAYNLNPTERMVYVTLADYYRSSGNYKQAITLLETGEQIFDNFYSGILILADCYLNAGANKKAIEKYKWIDQTSFKKDNVFKSWLYYKIGLAYESVDKDSAVNYYRDAIYLDPKNDFIQYSFENFAMKVYKVDSPIRKELALIHYNQALGAYQKGETRNYLLNLKRAITLFPFLIEARQKLVTYFELRKDFYNAYQELKSLEQIEPSFKVKDKIATYEWNIKNKKMNLEKVNPYYYKGLFVVRSDFFNFSPVYSEIMLYNSEYFDKFKFSTMDFRKRQGINTILEYIREYNYNFFIIADLDDSRNTLQFTLYDKTARIIDSLLVNFNIDEIHQSVINGLEWLNGILPSVWVIGNEISPAVFTISGGLMNGIKANDPLTAFDLSSENIRPLSLWKVTKAGDFSSQISLVSNFNKNEPVSLKDKFAVKNEVFNQKLLTKFKRVLGY